VTFEYAPAPVGAGIAEHYAHDGYQTTVRLGALMRRNRVEFGSRPAVLDGDVTMTWRQLIDAAARFAGFLSAKDVGPGDVVTWQLPNWWETLVVAYGIWAAGALSNPIVPLYRERELRAVVAAVRPACVVTAAEFRGQRHVDMLAGACEAEGWEPKARVVVRGRATGWTALDEADRARGEILHGVDPDAPAMIGFTSGTTSGAKGVVHSTRSFVASPLRSCRWMGTSWRDRSYMPAPVAHATGVLSAIAIPVFTGASVVLRDRWDAVQALDDIAKFGVTLSAGAAVFIQELLDALDARGQERLELSSGYPCGGSTIPSSLARAADARGMFPARSFGMTECPSVTGSSPRLDPPEIRLDTDGWVAPGCEVRVVDEKGQDLPPGQEGEFWIRGPQRALGYIDPAHTAEGFDPEGWFRTGDVGILAVHEPGPGETRLSGTVTGRLKDIINRGGEKLSSREIEEAILAAPGVVEAAVVAAPHPRLGEQPAAFVMFRAGQEVPFEQLASFLRSTGMAPQKIPQVWREAKELPRTASGKVKKYELQAALR